jgi:hypothetical protein
MLEPVFALKEIKKRSIFNRTRLLNVAISVKSYRTLPEESKVESREHQDNANIHCQPFPGMISEEN